MITSLVMPKSINTAYSDNVCVFVPQTEYSTSYSTSVQADNYSSDATDRQFNGVKQ